MKIRDIFKNPPTDNLAFYLKALADDLINIINRGGLSIADNLPFKIVSYTVGSGVPFIVGISEVALLNGISIIDSGTKTVTGFSTVRLTENTMNVTVTFSAAGTGTIKLLLIGQ